MKISVVKLKQYGGKGLDGSIEQLVEKIGTQLGAVEEVVDLGKKYQGVLVVKVVACSKHENSDHLNVCKIDDGRVAQHVERDEHGYVQVVCGAPNVRAGMMAVWLPPGSTVPESFDKDPFILEARELRGVVSNGMLASPREAAVSEDHDGILEIEDHTLQPGQAFAEAYQLNDHIIDIENKMFTHRPDCFGLLGVAREISGIHHQAYHSPEWYRIDAEIAAPSEEVLPFEVRNELPELVPRFTAIAMGSITVKPSPVWLQTELNRLGIRPINNVVDLTNYYMLLTGQPIHAYDYDKVKALSETDYPLLVVRHPKAGERITLLNGKTIEPRSDTMMVATDSQLICVGGAMGGVETEVDAATKNIIIEAATWDMFTIRRTSMAHGIFTDAVTRFNKGQSPLQNRAVIAKIVTDLERLAGGQVASPFIDDNHVAPEVLHRGSVHLPVEVSASFINERLGLQLTAAEMQEILQNVEFDVRLDDETLTVKAPFWRTDIELPEDVVEEIGRLYGYDRLPLILPKRDLTPAHQNDLLGFKAKIRSFLAKAGANEVLTYSFVHGNLLDKVGQSREQAFQLSNALSPDLQYFRLSLAPSLLEKVHANIKAGFDEFALFEMGKAHITDQVDDNGLPHEFERLSLVFAAEDKAAAKQYAGAPYYQARKYLDALLSELGFSGQVRFEPLGADDTDIAATYYAEGRAATVKLGDATLGRVGEYKPTVAKALKLPKYCAGFELGLAPLLLHAKRIKRYTPLSRFPSVEQDICLRVAADVPYAELENIARKTLSETASNKTYWTLEPLDIYQREGDDGHKQVTFRLNIADYEKTLRDTEVSDVLNRVADKAHEILNAERV